MTILLRIHLRKTRTSFPAIRAMCMRVLMSMGDEFTLTTSGPICGDPVDQRMRFTSSWMIAWPVSGDIGAHLLEPAPPSHRLLRFLTTAGRLSLTVPHLHYRTTPKLHARDLFEYPSMLWKSKWFLLIRRKRPRCLHPEPLFNFIFSREARPVVGLDPVFAASSSRLCLAARGGRRPCRTRCARAVSAVEPAPTRFDSPAPAPAA